MSHFTPSELAYLQGKPHLGRLATVGPDGTPHVTPVGWSYNPDPGTIDVGRYNLARTKKFRDVARAGRAAIVVDDVPPTLASAGHRGPRGGRGDRGPTGAGSASPARIVSWGSRAPAAASNTRGTSPEIAEARGARPIPSRSKPWKPRVPKLQP